jgi:predicted nucleic acid-binding protein
VRIIVSDASSLILLAKTDMLETYSHRVTLIAPTAVFQEAASSALQARYADARTISALADAGRLHVEKVTSRRKLPIALGTGEAQTIRLFLQSKADAVLSDDGRAIRTCRMLGVPFSTTPRVIVDLHRAELVTTREARRSLEKLAIIGRYAPEIVAAALVRLTEEQA